MWKSTFVSLTSTPTLICGSTGSPVINIADLGLHDRFVLNLRNYSTVVLPNLAGSSTVSTAFIGYVLSTALSQGSVLQLPMTRGEELWGIATAACNVGVLANLQDSA